MTGYNKLIRPVVNDSEVLRVKLKLRLSQLLDVHEKNQIMTTNVWLKQEWTDINFRWNPAHYGGVRVLHIPADRIWLPDIVLYNNADGHYQVTIMTKAEVTYDGTVLWEPPAIYRRSMTDGRAPDCNILLPRPQRQDPQDPDKRDRKAQFSFRWRHCAPH